MSDKHNLDKAYDASGIEDVIYKDWEEGGSFKPDLSLLDSFSIAMPPPNATGTLHLGHASGLTFEDLMARYNRMKGKSVLWLPGTDHAAIATQSVVEKKLQKDGILRPRIELGREKLLSEIVDFVEKSKNTIRNQIRKMGASCDFSREKYTLDGDLNNAVNTMFKYMFEDGLIYRGNRIVNWDPKMQTTVADDEVEYVEEKSKFYYFQYGPVVIGTARPETKFLDKVIVVHPDDERYKDLIGKKFEFEWIEGKVEALVIADNCIDMALGTGAMTITPAHSLVDFELANKYDLEIAQIIDFDGKILHEVSKEFGGLKILDAREKVVSKLREKGMLVSIDEKYEHKKSVNYRGKGLLEPQVMKQWFIDVNKKVIDWKGEKMSLKEVMIDSVKSEMIEMMPKRFEKTYFHWINNLQDWCISRQIWWGHRIPIWYKVSKDSYEKLLSMKDFTTIDLQKNCYDEEICFSILKPNDEEFWIQDPDTLDTWFSSALWTFSTLGWPENTEDFKKFHPTNVMETAYDIIFFWVARMILASTYCLRKSGLSEENSIPFKKVFFHGIIRDRNGKKMSKSSPETCIDPLDMINKYGADALRLSLIIGSSAGSDMSLYEEKIAGYRNFINKIWNISRYILMTTEECSVENINNIKLSDPDRWILSKFNNVVTSVTDSIDSYMFSQAGETIYNFLWNEFADWYIEVSKITKDKDIILRYILLNSLKLMHPFIPFVTEYLWKIGSFSDKKLIVESWPKKIDLVSLEQDTYFEVTKEIVSNIRSERSYMNIAPVKILDIVVIKGNLSSQDSILRKLARIKDIIYDSNFKPKPGDIFISCGDFDLYLRTGDDIDINKVIEKIQNDIFSNENLLFSINQKLSNKSFVDNAPLEIVNSERSRLLDLEEKIKKLKIRLNSLIINSNHG